MYCIHSLQAVKKVSSRYSGCGIRSASFRGEVLTIGTGLGMLMFYDLRAGKYLDSSINSSRTVVLKTSRGYVVSNEIAQDYVSTNQFIHSSPMKNTWITSKTWNMFLLFIHTVTTPVALGYLLRVGRCQPPWLVTMLVCGNSYFWMCDRLFCNCSIYY